MTLFSREPQMSFASDPLDRASARRGDPAWLAAQTEAGRILPFWKDKPFIADGRAGFRPWQAAWEAFPHVFLGLDGAQAVFAVDLTGAGGSEAPPVLDGGAFEDMRASAQILPVSDASIAGQAKSLLDWHRRHGFCPNCGAPTQMRDGGYRRDCPACGAQHFPRTDPVVIMLPVLGDECLLGRNARFQNGLYSAFAGFIEPGETMEDAVRRELQEEAAMTVGAVRYYKSQPWPFPSSLMLGCFAQALSKDFQIDGEEIVDARWITKAEARARLEGTLDDGTMRMPMPIAIAHHLIRDWAES